LSSASFFLSPFGLGLEPSLVALFVALLVALLVALVAFELGEGLAGEVGREGLAGEVGSERLAGEVDSEGDIDGIYKITQEKKK